MAIVSVTCSYCLHDSHLNPEQVSVIVYSGEGRTAEIGDFYSFTCPWCCERVSKEATSEVLELLVQSARITPTLITLDAHEGPAITPDDVLEMALALEKWDGDLSSLSQ